MQTITQLIGNPIVGIIIALILVGSFTLHAYLKHKKKSRKPLMPNTCALIHKEIYFLNQEIDETSDTERLQVLTKRLLNLEQHLVSLQDYDMKNYPDFGVRLLWFFIIFGTVISLIVVTTILTF